MFELSESEKESLLTALYLLVFSLRKDIGVHAEIMIDLQNILTKMEGEDEN